MSILTSCQNSFYDIEQNYFYIRYSANSNGNPMTVSPQSDTKYMGVCNTTSASAPSDYTKYTWSQCRGSDGSQGVPGTAGTDGKSQYLHIKYSDDGKIFTSTLYDAALSITEETVLIPQFVNLFPAQSYSSDLSSVFNGIGYIQGYRYSASTGKLGELSYVDATGLIPCKLGQTIRSKNCLLGAGNNKTETGLCFWDSNGSFIKGVNRGNLSGTGSIGIDYGMTFDNNGDFTFTISSTYTQNGVTKYTGLENTAYVSISIPHMDTWKDVVITIDSELNYLTAYQYSISVPIKNTSYISNYRSELIRGSQTLVSRVASFQIAATPSLYFLTNPADYVGAVGDTAIFNVSSCGSDVLHQWQFYDEESDQWKSSTQDGNKTDTLFVPITAARNGKRYRCMITSGSTSVISSEATLSVGSSSSFSIIREPASFSGIDGSTVIFRVATLSEATTKRWNKITYDGESLGAYIGTLVDFNSEDSPEFSDYVWKKFTEDVDDELDALDKKIQNKNSVYYQISAPSGSDYRINDVWFDTDNNNLMHMWDGSSWIPKTFGATAISDNSISTEKLYGDTAIMQQIISGSIQANSIAIGDYTNYCQLNELSASKFGFDIESDAGGSWFVSNPVKRDKQISEWYPAKSGDKFLIKYQIATSLKGNTSSGGTNSVYVPSRIALFTRDGTHANRTYNFATPTTPSDDSLSVVDVACIITLPTPSDRTVAEFAVYLQTESYGNFSGTLKIRNVQVRRMTTGELIVNGSVTADKIDVNDLFAQDITATGTISGLKLRGEDIDIVATSTNSDDEDPGSYYYRCEVSTPIDSETQVRYIQLKSSTKSGQAESILRMYAGATELESDFDVTGLTTFYGSIPHYASSRRDSVYFMSPVQHILPDEANKQMWTYDKYADGRLRCTCNISISTSVSTALGNMYRSGSVYTVDNYAYPLAFTGQPIMNINFLSTNNSSAMVWIVSSGTTTRPPTCYLVRPTSSTDVQGYLSITVEGYWKDYSY